MSAQEDTIGVGMPYSEFIGLLSQKLALSHGPGDKLLRVRIFRRFSLVPQQVVAAIQLFVLTRKRVNSKPSSLIMTRSSVRMILLFPSLLFVSYTTAQVVVSGDVRNRETGEVLFPATIRIEGTNIATVTNSDGRFELTVEGFPVILSFSHIGFRSDTMRIVDSAHVRTRMTPVLLELDEIVVTAEDPATSIMRKVIERKKAWRQDLESLKANAYTRLTIRKDSKIVSVVESMSEAFWREDGGWREILKAKRMTRNMAEDLEVPAVAFIDNLYDDNVMVGGHSLQGVTHPDALETYDFKLASRRKMDDRTVYDIEVRSKSPRSSAFVGTVSVLDEAYALIDVYLRPNESFLFPPPFRHFAISFHQQYRQFGRAWLPVDLRTEVSLNIGILGFSIPPIRSEQSTRISDYEIGVAVPDTLFDSPEPLISDVASRSAPDSLLATAGVVIPLTEEEKTAFNEIDSTATLDKVFKPEGALARFFGDDGTPGGREGWSGRLLPYGWYNRVDEAYGSVHIRSRSQNGRTRIRTEVGYATGHERWSFGGELWRSWGDDRKNRIGLGYRRGSSPRQTSDLYSNFDGSTGLFGGEDYFDYYWLEHFYVRGRHKVRGLKLDLVLVLRIEKHESLSKTTDFAILSDFVQRPNPAIDHGNLRSVTFCVTHDSGVGPAAIFGERRLQLLVEHSHPGLMDSNFDFTQFRFHAGWCFKTFYARRMMSNVFDVTVKAGTKRGHLPPQRFGHLDASLERRHNPGTFRTLHENPYEGEHFFGVFWEHHFRTLPFEFLGWDALVRRNIGLIVFGGHGRTWISDKRLVELGYEPQYVDQFHHEIGVSINGLFGLLRADFAKRLDSSGYTFGTSFARVF